jgi:predicted ATPase
MRAFELHRRVLREVVARCGGVEVEMQGDSFHFAFAHARDAAAAAAAAQHTLAEHDWESEPIRVRMGIHTGEPIVSGNLYAGLDVHRAARVMSAGHGGQVLVSEATRRLLGSEYELQDLGEHRLKDLLAPVRLYQLGEGEFPPPTSLYRTNLPIPPTPFLGRERELADLAALLAEDGARLLTLTGPGGTGKTRLAVQAAAETAERYADGIFWVSLASLTEATLVMPRISQVFGLREQAGQTPGDVLGEYLYERETLIVLDNFEQLIDAAEDLAHLLARAPRLRLLVTSRIPLRVSAEHVYEVRPMALPAPGVADLSALSRFDAIRLFVARATSANPAFVLTSTNAGSVTELCRRLDGLPLALELAAARTGLLPPEAMLSRLGERLALLTQGARDAPERQKTLRATIEWSYRLLGEREQTLFARLAAFRGGRTIEAIEAVCDLDGDLSGDLLDRLEALIDSSLLRQIPAAGGEPRFVMLETIHEYAWERLCARRESEDVLRRHATYFCSFAEKAEPIVTRGGPEQAGWMARLEDEHDNLRAALQAFSAAGEGELQVRLAAALGPFWFYSGLWAEGQEALERALKASAGRTSARVAALYCASGLASVRGAYDLAHQRAREGVELAESLGDRYWRGRTLARLGRVASEQGHSERAVELCEDALSIFRELGDDFGISHAARELGTFALDRREYAVARRYLEEAHASNLARADRLRASTTLVDLGLVALHEGLLEEARERFQASLTESVELHFKDICAWSLEGLAAIEADAGDAGLAARLLGAAEAIWEEVGGGLSPADQPMHDRAVERVRTRIQSERLAAEWAAGRAIPFEELPGLAADTSANLSSVQT